MFNMKPLSRPLFWKDEWDRKPETEGSYHEIQAKQSGDISAVLHFWSSIGS